MIYLSLVQYVLHKSLTIIFDLVSDWHPLCFSCKLFREIDCHVLDIYKHKKLLWNHLGATIILKIPRETSLAHFSENILTHL